MVEACTHKDVINEAARHPYLVSGGDGNEVHAKGDRETINNRNGHKMAVVVYDLGQPENVVIVKVGRSDHGRVNGQQSVAVVREHFVAKRRNREAFLLVSRHDPSEKQLVQDEAGVDFPGICIGVGVLVDTKLTRHLLLKNKIRTT